MGHLEVFLLFLPIFNCFTSNCTKRREPSWWTRDNCGLPKMSFLLVFWPPSTFFTADFPLWLSSVSNNNVNEYLHIRICRGLSNVVLQVITSTLWGRWVNFILLNSKVSKTRFGGLKQRSPSHTALSLNLCFGTSNPLFLLPYFATAHLYSLISF